MTTESKPDLDSASRSGTTRPGRGSATSSAATGPPLVLVHGLGGLASNWRLVAPALAAERRVIVPELPGHGGSGRLEGAAERSTPSPTRCSRSSRPRTRCRRPGSATRSAASSACARPSAAPTRVSGLVLAAAAGISSATRRRRGDGDAARRRQAGPAPRPAARRVSRSRLGRTLAFGWWGVADPAGLDPEMAEAFLSGPPQHTDTLTARQALVASDPRPISTASRCPCLCLWGAQRQLGAAAGRHGVRTAAARAAAHDRRLRAPLDRRAPRRRDACASSSRLEPG